MRQSPSQALSTPSIAALRHLFFPRLLPAAVALFGTTLPALAQAPQGVLEEIVVTAQLRRESLQDVPVSVNALGGEKMFEAGIAKVEDLQAYVPNFTMSETGIGTNIYIRGIGSGINQGFEQSVGMYVDGVYHGRAQLARSPFLDLERVEVLRGPQNILYGKNSIAGAVSLITAKPGDRLEGAVSATYEPEYNEQVYDVAVSAPITDTLGVRVAYRNRSADGYIDNLTLDRDEPALDEETARITFAWRPNDRFDVTFKYEYGEFDSVGRAIEIVNDQPALAGPFAGLNYGQILRNVFGQDAGVLNNATDYKRSSNGDFSNNRTNTAVLTLNLELGDHTLTSITGFLTYQYDELCDCDFTGASLFNVRSKEDYDQWSQEFRIASPLGQTFEYIAGAYFQSSDLDFRDNFSVPANSIVPAVIDGLAPGAGTVFNGLNAPRAFTQDTDLWSVFAEVTWNVTDVFRITAGGRYSQEDKEGARNLQLVGPFAGVPAAPVLYANILQAESHALGGERDESNFSPLLIVEYDILPDLMVYASATRGFKSGGYDARSNASPGGPLYPGVLPGSPPQILVDGAFEYGEEEATGFEVGAKAAFGGGRAELNAAAFYTKYEDLQVSIFDGILGFNVGNAAEAVSQGVELDGRLLVTDGLVLSASLAWLDFEFKDYANGQCVQGQVPTTAGTSNCNFDGKSNQYVAEWSGTLSADYRVPLGAALELRAAVDLIYTDDYNPSQNLDARVRQDSYTKVNARVGLAGSRQLWEVALVGKNLTDEKIVTYANDAPLAYNFFGTVAHYGVVEAPRTVALQASYRF